jgi:hypothetical protein
MRDDQAVDQIESGVSRSGGSDSFAATPPSRGRRGDLERRLLDLQRDPNGVGFGIRTRLLSGRHEIVPTTLDPFVALLGSDPYNTPVGTGVLVPATPTGSLVTAGKPPSQFRYLFLLAREQFNSGEQGVRLTGIRQYAELTATVTGEGGSIIGTFKKEITSPLWHPPDGSVSWHVMYIPKTAMVTRNVQNADSLMFRDAYGPCMLYETIAGPQFAPTGYTPPNGGRPWGKPLGSVSLGNMHDMRYRWRQSQLEQTLDIPVPLPCDVALFASVRQNDPSTNPAASSLSANQFTALGPEDQFLTSFPGSAGVGAQYGRIAGSLVFDENLGEDVP